MMVITPETKYISFAGENKQRKKAIKDESLRDTIYQAALVAVEMIDTDLTRGTCHYRTKNGQLLSTLDQVVRAILADNLEPERGYDV